MTATTTPEPRLAPEGPKEHVRTALAILHTPLLTVDRERGTIIAAAIERLWKALDQLEERRKETT